MGLLIRAMYRTLLTGLTTQGKRSSTACGPYLMPIRTLSCYAFPWISREWRARSVRFDPS